MNLVNARYGSDPGVKAYSHVSDRFSPFATRTIPATVHEAPYILDGLLMNETGRRIRDGPQFGPSRKGGAVAGLGAHHGAASSLKRRRLGIEVLVRGRDPGIADAGG